MRAALYIRVSTDMQVEEGYSLDAQLHRLKAFCTSQDWSIVGVYTDEGISAKNTERPELQRMLTDIQQRKIDVVLVYKLDRLTRSVLDLQTLLETFDKYDVGFKSSTEVFDTTTASGRLFLTLVAAMAQWERETLGERVKMGMAQKARTGQWMGSIPPIGYRVDEDGNLQIDELGGQVIREIFDAYISGKGMVPIARELSTKNALGRRWTQQGIRYILANPVYIGKVRWGKNARSKVQMETVVVEGTHDPIISEQVFNDVQRIRSQRHHLPPRSGTGHYALVGLIRCGMCGSAVVGKGFTRKKNGQIYRSYTCNDQSRLCDAKSANMELVEEMFLSELEKEVEALDVEPTTSPEPINVKPIERELRDIARKKKRWLDAFEAEKIDAETMQERISELTSRQLELEHKLDESKHSVDAQDRAALIDTIKRIRKLWAQATVEERRELARKVTDEIVIIMRGHGDVSMQISVRF